MDEASGLLRHARALVRRGWTQHADARADDGSVVHPWDGLARSWSLLGALVAALEQTAASHGEPNAIRALAQTCALLADTIDTDSLELWNDSAERTSDEVVAALDFAITGTRRDGFSGFSQN